jgi:hypothetical protein
MAKLLNRYFSTGTVFTDEGVNDIPDTAARRGTVLENIETTKVKTKIMKIKTLVSTWTRWRWCHDSPAAKRSGSASLATNF